MQTLRAFEAAARHESYSRAAVELGITHGAVSHRIRALEAEVEAVLFRRIGNAMVPTDEARRLLVPVRRALGLLDDTFGTKRTRPRRLTISTLPSFAGRWLVPRLGAFRAEYPDIDLRLDTRLEFAPLGPGGMDCAVRYGPGDWPGVRARRLAGERLSPVCSPAYRDQAGLREPADLASARLLRHDRQLWEPWFQAAGLDLPEPVDGPTYADAGLLLEAAAASEGVALGRGLLAAADIAAGKLVMPFSISVQDRLAYHVVSPPNADPATDRMVEIFGTWLAARLAEAEA